MNIHEECKGREMVTFTDCGSSGGLNKFAAFRRPGSEWLLITCECKDKEWHFHFDCVNFSWKLCLQGLWVPEDACWTPKDSLRPFTSMQFPLNFSLFRAPGFNVMAEGDSDPIVLCSFGFHSHKFLTGSSVCLKVIHRKWVLISNL
jgi:hypothetical protein